MSRHEHSEDVEGSWDWEGFWTLMFGAMWLGIPAAIGASLVTGAETYVSALLMALMLGLVEARESPRQRRQAWKTRQWCVEAYSSAVASTLTDWAQEATVDPARKGERDAYERVLQAIRGAGSEKEVHNSWQKRWRASIVER